VSNNVHDKLFRRTFSQVEHARGQIARMLPPELAERVDVEALALCPGSFVDEALKERHTDLLFSVSIRGRPALLYLLLEHQSQVDARMPFRLLRYMVRIWESHLQKEPKATLLPAIVPLVVHHSEEGWRAATRFEELLDLDAEGLAAVAAHVPRFRLLLDDISFESDEALRGRAMSALGRLVLWCLRSGRNPAWIVQNIGEWVELIREVRRAPHGAAALAMIWRYILTVEKRQTPEEVVKMLSKAVGSEEREELRSVADQLIERGLQRGLQQGVQLGLRTTLRKQLTLRVGALPEAAVARVNAAEQDELDVWAERVLTASTLAEVLGEL